MYGKKDIEMLKKGGIVIAGVFTVFLGLVGYQLYSNHQEAALEANTAAAEQAQAADNQSTADNVTGGSTANESTANDTDVLSVLPEDNKDKEVGYLVTAPDTNHKVVVTEDKDGNQTIKPQYPKKPESDSDKEAAPTPDKDNPNDTNPNEKPKDDPDKQEPANPNTPQTPDETSPDAGKDEPQGGEVKDGKTYVSGFGWVEGTGDTHFERVGNPNDELTGNKVGIM